MLDSVKVHGKTKDVFGWPEESDEGRNATSAATSGPAGSGGIVQGGGQSACVGCGFDGDRNQLTNITPLDRIVSAMLEVWDSGLFNFGRSKC